MAPTPPPPPPPIVIFTLAFARSVRDVAVRSALVASIPGLQPAQVLAVAMTTPPMLTRRLSELSSAGGSYPLNSTVSATANGTAASGTAADIQLEPSPSLSHTNILAIINGSVFLVLMSAELGVSVSLASEAQLHVHEHSSALTIASAAVALESTLIPLVAIAASILCFCYWYQRGQRLANSLLSKDGGFDSAAVDDSNGASGSGGGASPSSRKRIKEALQKRGFASKRAQIMPVGAPPTGQSKAVGDESTGEATRTCEDTTGADVGGSPGAATRGRSVYAQARRRRFSVAVAPSPNAVAGAQTVDTSRLAAQRGSTKSFKLGFREALMHNSGNGSKAGSPNLLGSHSGRSDEGGVPSLAAAQSACSGGGIQRVRSNGAILRAKQALGSWNAGRGSRARLQDAGGEGEPERASKAADRTSKAEDRAGKSDDRASKAAGSSEPAASRESRRDGGHGVGGGFNVTRL